MRFPARPVRGTILRNRPVFEGRTPDGETLTGTVAFSRPMRAPGGRTTHFRVAVALSDGRIARGYWTPGTPAELKARWEQ